MGFKVIERDPLFAEYHNNSSEAPPADSMSVGSVTVVDSDEIFSLSVHQVALNCPSSRRRNCTRFDVIIVGRKKTDVKASIIYTLFLKNIDLV